MPQPQDNYRTLALVIILLWLFWSPDAGGPGFSSSGDLEKQRITRHRAALGVLNASTWGDFVPASPTRPDDGEASDPLPSATPKFLNLTGFREADNYGWADLERFRSRCLQWSRSAIPPVGGEDLWDQAAGEPVWQNVSGMVRGTWVRKEASTAASRTWESYNLSAVAPAFDWRKWGGSGAEEDKGMTGQGWLRNITGEEGKIILKVDEKKKADIVYEEDGSGEAAPGHVALPGPKSGGRIRGVKALITLEDSAGSGSSWHMRLHGVHWPKQGTLLLTTTSEKFDGLFGLPHLTPGPNFFSSSQRLLNESIYKVLVDEETRRGGFGDGSGTLVPWASDLENLGDLRAPSPQCEYVLYAQVHPPDRDHLDMRGFDPKRESMANIIGEIEEELRRPLGRPIRGVPELQMSAVLWSPDCGYFLETKGPPLYVAADGQHLVGMKADVVLYEAKVWLLAYALVLFGQVYFLRLQVKESFTPSTIGRISYVTMGMMLMADGLIFGSSCAWVLSATNTHLASLAVAFASFLSMMIGGSFLAEIHKVQEPVWRRRAREQASASSTPPAATPAVEPGGLPRPVTAGPPRASPRPATPPIIIPSDQDIDAEIAERTSAAAAVPRPANTTATTTQPQQPRELTFSNVVGRMVLGGMAILVAFVAAASWWPSVRAAFFNVAFFLYLSLWVPQIHRNVLRNCRRALNWRFVIGQSVLRLLPLAYFYLREDNVLLAEPDRYAFAVFCAWVWIQLWALAFQDVLGPRFGIPRSWTPDAWDYHPVLREDSVEAGGLPIGLVSAPGSPTLERVRTGSLGEKDKKDGSAKGKKGQSTRVIDCAICREDLEVPVVKAGHEDGTAGGVVGVFARRMYMVTPCRHIFHSACLEGWMRFRLQCPICREELPPL